MWRRATGEGPAGAGEKARQGVVEDDRPGHQATEGLLAGPPKPDEMAEALEPRAHTPAPH
jgi:hypothetical protein